MTLPEGLLDDIKIYLNITWNDVNTDKNLEGITSRGMAYLNDIAGSELDFTQEGEARALLFDYCRYARSHALEDFERNFRSGLMAMQIRMEVAAYEAENTDL